MDGQLVLCKLRSCLRLRAVIEQNRLAQQEKALVLPIGEPDYQDDEVHLGAESFIGLAA